VQDGLVVVDSVRVEFKAMIKSVLCKNNKRQNDYRRYCRSVNKPYYGPNLDCPTRWNSTWNMMHVALKHKETLQLFHDNLADKHKVPNKFDDFSWSIIEKLTDLLGVFKNATTYLSGVYYPTSPLVLNQIYYLANKISDFEYEGPLFKLVGETMKDKLLKYFKELPPVFTCAAALNPVVNVGGVETLIEQIAFSFKLTEDDPNFILNQQNYFNKCFRDMFDVYLTKYGASNVIHDQMRAASSSRGGSSSNVNITLFNTLVESQSKRSRTTTPSSELGNYMSTNFFINYEF
jgi:hypothetical protein